MKRVLRYIKNTNGLFILNNHQISVVTLSNRDRATCPDDRKSPRGYAIYLVLNSTLLDVKKQQKIAVHQLNLNIDDQVVWLR